MRKHNSWNFPFLSHPSWKTIFQNDNPLELEIGTGRPHFLFERARAAPEHNIVGIEWKGEWVLKAQKKAARENVGNVHALWGNAWELVPCLFEDNSLTQITLNFPDPWWKKKHHKRKVINDPFVDILVSKLKDKGRIYFQTDVENLFLEYLDTMESHVKLKNLAGSKTGLSENPQNARSHREKKCEKMGIPVYRAWLEKLS